MINIKQFKKLLGGKKPKIAIILGSGLGKIAQSLSNSINIKYSEIEGFPQSHVIGHNNIMTIGNIGEKEVLCMQGRFHLYEGYPSYIIHEIISTLKKIGIKQLIITNAAGSLNPKFHPGDLMLISDHINFCGQNPLININNPSAPIFCDMSNAYDKKLREIAKIVAKNHNIKLHEGVYLMVLGPSFETSAEVRLFRSFNADAIGMSTAPEVISAASLKMKVIAFSSITNFGTGMQKNKLSHKETLDNAGKAAQKLSELITHFIMEQ